MQGITHRLGARGDLVTVCVECERRDPDFERLNPNGAIYLGVHFGRRPIEHCDHPDHGGAE